MITGLGIPLRPMIRKGKSLLFGRISRTFFFKNCGSGGGTAENPHLPPNLFPFLAELDNFEIFLEKNKFVGLK